MTLQFRCNDDPEARGRVAGHGDRRFTVKFLLESGVELQVSMGKEGINEFACSIAQMMIDDSVEVAATEFTR